MNGSALVNVLLLGQLRPLVKELNYIPVYLYTFQAKEFSSELGIYRRHSQMSNGSFSKSSSCFEIAVFIVLRMRGLKSHNRVNGDSNHQVPIIG